MIETLSVNQARHRLFPLDEKESIAVVVAVSGGADSLFLLYALNSLAKRWRLALHVAHIDHAIRPASGRDAAHVAAVAEELQLPYHGHRLDPGALNSHDGGLENAAREARYAFLCNVAISVTPAWQKPILAVAHHADDQAETVVMNLVRGAGQAGLGGMHWVRKRTCRGREGRTRTVHVVRPLLNLRREEIRTNLHALGIDWCEDSTNQDPNHTRNRVRLQIMPALEAMNPNLVAGIFRTASILQTEADRAQSQDRNYLERLHLPHLEAPIAATCRSTSTRIVLARDDFERLTTAARRGVLRLALDQLTPAREQVGFERIEELLQKIAASPGAGGPYPLSQQISWSLTGASTLFPPTLSLHRADAAPFISPYPAITDMCELPLSGPPRRVAPDSRWSIRIDHRTVVDSPAVPAPSDMIWQALFNADALGSIALDHPRPGMRFAPLGMAVRHKLLSDFMTDRKIPNFLRATWPLLVDSDRDRVLWVCGLQPSHHARVDSHTQRVATISWTRHRATRDEG